MARLQPTTCCLRRSSMSCQRDSTASRAWVRRIGIQAQTSRFSIWSIRRSSAMSAAGRTSSHRLSSVLSRPHFLMARGPASRPWAARNCNEQAARMGRPHRLTASRPASIVRPAIPIGVRPAITKMVSQGARMAASRVRALARRRELFHPFVYQRPPSAAASTSVCGDRPSICEARTAAGWCSRSLSAEGASLGRSAVSLYSAEGGSLGRSAVSLVQGCNATT